MERYTFLNCMMKPIEYFGESKIGTLGWNSDDVSGIYDYFSIDYFFSIYLNQFFFFYHLQGILKKQCSCRAEIKRKVRKSDTRPKLNRHYNYTKRKTIHIIQEEKRKKERRLFILLVGNYEYSFESKLIKVNPYPSQ